MLESFPMDEILYVDEARINGFVGWEHSSNELPMFVSSVSAGFASLIEDFMDKRLTLDELIVRNKAASFLVRVGGTSMIGAGIMDKAVLLVDKSMKPKHNDIVIAVLDNEFFVKRLRITPEGAFLVPDNPKYPISKLDEDRGDYIWAVVVAAINSFR